MSGYGIFDCLLIDQLAYGFLEAPFPTNFFKNVPGVKRQMLGWTVLRERALAVF
jgi:hypothetical protein